MPTYIPQWNKNVNRVRGVHKRKEKGGKSISTPPERNQPELLTPSNAGTYTSPVLGRRRPQCWDVHVPSAGT
jgi:hypothetical protein